MPEVSGSIWSAAILLFFVMDPLGNIPVLLSVLKGVEARRQRFIILREVGIALGILLLFLFAGETILTVLHLQQESVSIAGGIVLLIIGLRMIFPQRDGIMGKQIDGEPFIVPIAVPMIAGPSALATLILMAKNDPTQKTNLLFALLIAWTLASALLLAAPLLYRLLRERGLGAIERLMGMILVMMAVQMLVNGFGELT